jgi:TRAP-type C4-dicarboxylate transport system substrate-binding protein
MNKAKWNKLPADVKKIISDINDEWIIKHGDAWDSSDFAGVQFFLSKGGVIIGLDSKESDRWKQAVSPVIDDFVAAINKKGFNGREIVDFTMKNLEDLSK